MRAGVQGNTDSEGTPPAFFTIQDLMNLNGHDYMFVSHSGERLRNYGTCKLECSMFYQALNVPSPEPYKLA